MPASQRIDEKNLPAIERIGAYRLHRHVEATAAIQVHLAREDRPQGGGREVVLKVVQSASPEDVDDIDELRRQAPMLCKLQHPSIVRTLEFFEHQDSLVLVLESVDGVSLAELLENQRGEGKANFSDAAAFHIAVSVLDALAYAHGVSDASGAAAPVIHRCVSPANVLVMRDGTVKLGGFGFVKPFGISTDGRGRLQWEAPCMAPEQIEGQSPTPKVDVYAVGLILWELLSGRPARVLPHHPLSAHALSATTKRPEPLETVRPDLALELTAMVDAAVADAPHERLMTCAEMARRIRKFAPVGAGKKDLAALMRAVPSVSLAAPRSATSLVPRPSPRDEARASGARPKVSAAVLVMPIVAVAAPEVANESSTASTMSAAEPTEEIVVQGEELFEEVLAEEAPAEEVLLEDLIVADDRVDEAALPIHASGIRHISLLDQLQKPTRWDRRTLLGIWMGLLMLLASFIIALRNRAPTSSPPAVQAAFIAPKEPAAPEILPKEPGAPEMRPAEVEPQASAVVAPEPSPSPPLQNPVADPPLPPGFGRLTVHSSSPAAMVYGKLNVYGAVEDALVVPCGRQFFRIGIPGPKAKRIAWLGRGRTIQIACGQAVEITMGKSTP